VIPVALNEWFPMGAIMPAASARLRTMRQASTWVIGFLVGRHVGGGNIGVQRFGKRVMARHHVPLAAFLVQADQPARALRLQTPREELGAGYATVVVDIGEPTFQPFHDRGREDSMSEALVFLGRLGNACCAEEKDILCAFYVTPIQQRSATGRVLALKKTSRGVR
jgi:hypothetical protein